jgi:hypothetical protein
MIPSYELLDHSTFQSIIGKPSSRYDLEGVYKSLATKRSISPDDCGPNKFSLG